MKLSTKTIGTWLLCGWMSANAAILTTEDFTTDPGNVTDRDGNMTVAHNGSGYMTGTFASQAFPSPETDAFNITIPDFMGDYSGNGLTQIAFDFFAVNVVPSDLFIRLIDGSNVFSYQFTTLALGANSFTVDLVYSFGWTGLNSGAFATALTSIDAIEIEMTRSGTGAQEYRLDNLQTLNTPLGGGGGPSAVPEPNTLSFIALVVAGGLAWRRRLMSRTFGHA